MIGRVSALIIFGYRRKNTLAKGILRRNTSDSASVIYTCFFLLYLLRPKVVHQPPGLEGNQSLTPELFIYLKSLASKTPINLSLEKEGTYMG